MFYCKLSTITNLIIITFYGLIASGRAENIIKLEDNKQLNKTLEGLIQNVTNSRSGRTLIAHARTPAFTLRRRQPVNIRARTDHLPHLRGQIRRVHNNLANVQPHQQQQNGIRFGYESLKSSKYLPSSSKAANLAFANSGKGGAPYRPQLLGGHPNSIHVPALSQQYMHNFKASPAFNGQVVVHPAMQTQQKQQQSNAAQQDNSYPKYVKPPTTAAIAAQSQATKQQQLQQQLQQQQTTLTKYPEFKQYPIPDLDKMQQHNKMHEKYMQQQQQQQFLIPNNPLAYYQLQHTQQQHQQRQQQHAPQQSYAGQQPVQQYLAQPQQQQPPSIPIYDNSAQTTTHHLNNVAFPAASAVAPPKMYSVHEENDMTELQTNNYQTATYQQGLDKEAQEYLRFMNSDEYFLPKKEPNYKQIADESDKRQAQQQHLHAMQQTQQTTPQQKPHQQLSSSQNTQYSNTLYSDAIDAAAYNKKMPVSRLFYKQDAPTAASASASSTVVRSSYQTGYNQNQFFANPQDSKIGKYTVASPSISTSTTIVYPQVRHNTAGNTSNRTPEPLRFEFTERDAMVGGYSHTNAPQAHLRLTSRSVTPIVPSQESSTISLTAQAKNYQKANHHAIKPVVEESEDDLEDGDDVQETGTNFFGRQPVAAGSDFYANKPSSATEAPPSEQKDTEEYCERICAIVEDENEEIVCGSDGYMYTSEAQMECYASCLHIDVTIHGKGSCSTR